MHIRITMNNVLINLSFEEFADFFCVLQGALELCNAAAAKTRAAMDAPYNNAHSLTFARMKHNTCVMRARSLHRRILIQEETAAWEGQYKHGKILICTAALYMCLTQEFKVCQQLWGIPPI